MLQVHGRHKSQKQFLDPAPEEERCACVSHIKKSEMLSVNYTDADNRYIMSGI